MSKKDKIEKAKVEGAIAALIILAKSPYIRGKKTDEERDAFLWALIDMEETFLKRYKQNHKAAVGAADQLLAEYFDEEEE